MFDFNSIKQILSDHPVLPGESGHKLMMARTASGIARPSKLTVNPENKAKQSAVLLLLTANGNDSGNQLSVVFTLRSTKLRSHSGQISFPGGRIDTGESPMEAALRETREEIGITEPEIEIVGRLSTIHVPPSNSDIHPYIGFTKSQPYIASPDEVEEVFTSPLSHLTEPRSIKTSIRKFDGIDYSVPYIDVHHNVPLWGATGIILAEFITLLRQTN